MTSIAHFHADLPPETHGGVAHQVHELANSQVAGGHQVLVYSFSPRPPDALYEVQTLPFPTAWRRSALLRLIYTGVAFARVRTRAADVAHYHGDNHFCRPGIPSIRTFYGAAVDEMRHARGWRWRLGQALTVPLEHLGGRAAQACVGISEVTCRSLGFVHTVIPCGVDLERFSDAGPRSVSPSILFVGTMEGRKQGRLLERTFKQTVQSKVPGAELWLVCPEKVEGDGVRWMGRVGADALAAAFRSAWVFCLPSSYEGFGVPYIEALAAGAAVVATPNPGAMEVLAQGRFGRVVDPSGLGQALTELLTDETARRLQTEAGRIRAREYSWTTITERYEALYAQLMRTGSP